MENPEMRLEELFNRYYNGLATASEKEELMAFIRLSKDDAVLEKFLKKGWEELNPSDGILTNETSNAMLSSILDATPKDEIQTKVIRIGWLRYAAAAAVFVLIGLGAWWKLAPDPATKIAHTAQPKTSDVKPGGAKALLTLSDGSAIELASAKSGFLTRQGDAEVSKSQEGILVYNAKPGNATEKVSINTLSTPKGGQYEVLLPDGSKVWLNASSSIRFPSTFPSSERKVEITGEAYFEVAKDKSRPFRVKFNKSEVQVLGTSFNIMAYPEEGPSKTTLVEGSVFIRNVNQNTKLKPGQQAAVLSTGKIKTRYIALDEAVAWKNGMFYFKDASVEEVMRQLSRWYDVEVLYAGKIPVRQFTGRVSRHVNLSEVSGMLRYAGVNCRIEGSRMIIDP
ncbi:FecR family protein [Dyadobacter chenhuakuii]|uniref:FecR domain-containing protein n=1 Tax=Dyadobacter chenhuakuii TaxID=2909339 RepID=A0ABY4XQD9_9BACT|nr:FecR family protein [Dyadobacter chenhuakuii]MCF2493063.1 FecR domain-containing protein [Dyadobacter chenhuakuii]USJ32650.1 FecR domain-containing protein [Dyadobacter chenhuakuii]